MSIRGSKLMKHKEQIYQATLQAIRSMIDGEDDLIAVLSTVSCELFQAFPYWNWVGFYRRVDPDTLKVGPYQGGHGCLTIDNGRGVCGACVREKAVQIVPDVHAVPHHIACSSETRSEIVLPVLDKAGEVVAVLDIDSTEPDAFDGVDQRYLEKIIGWIRPLFPGFTHNSK
jgi:L-methionine (R)-S-oxide reductase